MGELTSGLENCSTCLIHSMLLRFYNTIVENILVINILFYFDEGLHFQISFLLLCRKLFYYCGDWLILTGSFLHLNQIFGRKWDGKVQTHQQILGVWSRAICFSLTRWGRG